MRTGAAARSSAGTAASRSVTGSSSRGAAATRPPSCRASRCLAARRAAGSTRRPGSCVTCAVTQARPTQASNPKHTAGRSSCARAAGTRGVAAGGAAGGVGAAAAASAAAATAAGRAAASSSDSESRLAPRAALAARRVVAVRLLARGVGALRGTLTGEGDFERRRTGLGFGDLVERAGIVRVFLAPSVAAIGSRPPWQSVSRHPHLLV